VRGLAEAGDSLRALQPPFIVTGMKGANPPPVAMQCVGFLAYINFGCHSKMAVISWMLDLGQD